MTFILISGKTGVGKTHVCNKLHDMIALNSTFKVHNRQRSRSATATDFIAHYEKCDKNIVLNSPSDNDNCMIEFCQYLDGLAKNEVRPDIVITTIRETNQNNDQMSHMLALLDAFAKGTPNLAAYFNKNIANGTPLPPNSLSHHAFVLHLKDHKKGESKEEQEKALAQYWDDNADKVKYALDFALARL